VTASGHRVRSEHGRGDWPVDEVEGDEGRWRCRVAVGGNETWACAVRCRIWRVVPTSPTSSDRVVLSRHRPEAPYGRRLSATPKVLGAPSA
jgi:hypothetical protein